MKVKEGYITTCVNTLLQTFESQLLAISSFRLIPCTRNAQKLSSVIFVCTIRLFHLTFFTKRRCCTCRARSCLAIPISCVSQRCAAPWTNLNKLRSKPSWNIDKFSIVLYRVKVGTKKYVKRLKYYCMKNAVVNGKTVIKKNRNQKTIKQIIIGVDRPKLFKKFTYRW